MNIIQYIIIDNIVMSNDPDQQTSTPNQSSRDVVSENPTSRGKIKPSGEPSGHPNDHTPLLHS